MFLEQNRKTMMNSNGIKERTVAENGEVSSWFVYSAFKEAPFEHIYTILNQLNAKVYINGDNDNTRINFSIESLVELMEKYVSQLGNEPETDEALLNSLGVMENELDEMGAKVFVNADCLPEGGLNVLEDYEWDDNLDQREFHGITFYVKKDGSSIYNIGVSEEDGDWGKHIGEWVEDQPKLFGDWVHLLKDVVEEQKPQPCVFMPN